jgi:hypothetical protein
MCSSAAERAVVPKMRTLSVGGAEWRFLPSRSPDETNRSVWPSCWSVFARPRTIVLDEELVHESVGELAGHGWAGDQDPVVDGAEELVEGQIEIGVGG